MAIYFYCAGHIRKRIGAADAGTKTNAGFDFLGFAIFAKLEIAQAEADHH